MSNTEHVVDKWGFNADEIAARIAAKRTAFDLDGFAKKLKSKIYGQDAIIDAIGRQVKTRISRPNKRKPLCLALAGPSSVGKTETAKLLADALAMPLYIEPCNLLKESHKVSAITGSTLGYADSSTEPPMAKAISKAGGKAVILLDEFEKCHADVAAVFLSVFDEGSLKAAGNIYDCTQSIFLVTSNAGISNFDFDRDEPGTPASFDKIRKAMSEAFLPELLNRFAGIYMFKPLSDAARHRLIATQAELIIGEYHNLDESRSRDGMKEFVTLVLAGFGTDAVPNGRTLSNAVEQLLAPQLDDVPTGATVRIEPDGRIRPC